jgi:predicted dehydrogenase
MKIRVAVVGTGFIGQDHLAAYASWPDAEIVGVADADPGRAAQAGARFGVPSFGDVAALLAAGDVDAISVCVPTGLHLPVVRAAAAAGVSILLEKPMAITVAECDEIAGRCRAAGVTLMLGFTHRFHAELIRARELIAAGRLGPIGLVHDHFSFGEDGPWPAWYYRRDLSGGGELMHDAVHLVDRLAWLVGSPIVEVVGATTGYARGIPGVEDGGVAVLRFASGAIGSIFVNQSPHPLHRDSAAVPMPGRLELELHGPRGSLRYRTWQALEFDGDGGESWTVDDAPRDEMRLEIREFLDALAEGRPPSVGAAEGRRGIAVVGAIYESERIGGPVRVDELFPEPGQSGG